MTRAMICLLAGLAAAAAAQPSAQPTAEQAAAGPWDPASRLAAQREAMQALAFLDGAWRGSARMQGPGQGEYVHTERVGTLLDGTVRVIEGRAYDERGETVFNALGLVSYDPVRRAYSIQSHAEGYSGEYALAVRSDGFSWNHQAGPGVTMRYTATIRGGEWHEIGERVAGGAAPVKMFEMRLRRVAATEWPQAGAVAPR